MKKALRITLPAALVVVPVALALCACGTARSSAVANVDVAGMDKSVAPGDDFNAYANGGWIKATPIPNDKASYGSFMDEAAIESKGIAPLKPQLDAIQAIAKRSDLARVLGGQLRADVDALNSTNFQTLNLFGVWITQGLTDPSHSFPYLLQGGLGMPDRDYYLSSSPSMTDLRKQYQAHVAAIFTLAGFGDAAARAARVVALETKMAKVHATRVESEDVHMAVSWRRDELAAKAPGIEWPVLLKAAELNDVPVFIIWHPKAIPGLAALVSKEPLDAWKDWLLFHSIEKASGFLPDAFVKESFNFNGKALSGTPELRPRWQRGVDYTSAATGEAVGSLYVERYFPAETKRKVQAMVEDLVKAFGKRIDALSWMSPETKAKAKEKLVTLKVGVGYPDNWEDYSGLEIVKGDALGNQQRAELFEYRRQLAKLHQPVDRGEWWMTPQTVNAVNLPLQNALNFPAAILQPPYFDPKADAAHNYASMGAVIGHEISHSFDDQGSQFDAEGRLSNWWTKEDLDHFKAASEALAKQYDSYKPFPDLAVNGHLTLSENIADLAGLAAAYDAYHLRLNGAKANDQQFFVSFAQSWRSNS